MALSNILREPRRELTESVIGILALGAYLSVDYFVCTVLDPYYYEKYGPPWISGIIFSDGDTCHLGSDCSNGILLLNPLGG